MYTTTLTLLYPLPSAQCNCSQWQQFVALNYLRTMFSAARSCCALERRTYLLCYKDISVYDHNGRALGNCKSDIEFSGAYRHL